ncbi:MAG TPA: hypothetical protein VMF51_10485 [Nocardioides sp.]|uniref:hypothetical protein n=1 Tax=Nocardioides sp. TaxID=35761 RepID=UPI002B75E289|nr:hypothetical protein [Nocardioides sp.]HTW15547.1 hypothetical protein [Nocardioides sp.]
MSGRIGTDEDLLATIWSALDTTGVWVAPEVSAEIDPDELSAIQDAVADSPTPLYLVVQPLSDGDAFGGEPAELLTQLHDRYDADGLYLAPQFYGDFESLNLVERAWGTDQDAWDAHAVAEHRHGDEERDIADLGAYLADLTRLIADGDARAAYDEEVAPAREAASSTESSVPSTSPESSSDGSGDLAIVAVLGVGVLVAAIVVAAVRRRGPRTFALPDSVVSQVREAHADRIEQEARDLVLELGEAVRRSELDTDHDTGAWQAALDHYDAATRVLDGSDDLELLDAVGALVLARQARAALDAATSGKTFRPLRLCYLNPLHDSPGRTSMRLEQDGHTLDVPVCRTCRSDLKAGRDPDALRVERRGRAVLYVDSGVEPWASTAYGTLGTGLVGALHRRR